QCREGADARSSNVRFQPAVARPWTAGGEAGEAGEAWVQEGTVGQRNRACGAWWSVCVGGGKLARIRCRTCDHSANSEEWNSNGELKPVVWIGCNLTFKGRIASGGVEHRGSGSTMLLCPDRPPDA